MRYVQVMNTLLNLSEAGRGIGVLESTRPVVDSARHVWVDQRAVETLAQRIISSEISVPGWDERYHWSDGSEKTAGAILILDAWNFCFWPNRDEPKWSVEYNGEKLNGYRALAACVKRAIEEGVELYDPKVQATLTLEQAQTIFRGSGTIPLLEQRVRHANEVGEVLLNVWEGSFCNMLAACEGSAVTLAEMVAESFPCFRDVCLYYGREVKFYKRAQILTVDLAGALPENALTQFHDLDQLSAFADYKIPQVLEAYGVLRYSPQLQAQLERCELIPVGDPQEVEIRAAMVWGVEWLRQELAQHGRKHSAAELDWMLWELGQQPLDYERPYHRTRTIFY